MIVRPLLQQFIDARGLDHPDARPLHGYAASEAEYDSLQLMLRALDPSRTPSAQLCASFVLWASEMFRREFEGGRYKWEFLFGALELSTPSNHFCADLAKRGLAWWRRPLRKSQFGARMNLMSVLAEGGVPNGLLHNGGPFAQTILALVANVEALGADRDLAMEAARTHVQSLPQVWRGDDLFCELLADLAVEVAALRAAIPPEAREVAAEQWLDRNDPDWRRRLPLRLDDAAAASLLRDALRAPRAMVRAPRPVQRALRRGDDGIWRGHVLVADETLVPDHVIGPLAPDVHGCRLRPAGRLADSRSDLLLRAEREPEGWRIQRASGPRSACFDHPLEAPVAFDLLVDGRGVGRVEFDAPLNVAMDTSLWIPGDAGAPLRRAPFGRTRTRAEAVFVLSAQDAAVDVQGNLEIADEFDAEGGVLRELRGEGVLSVAGVSVRLSCGASEDETHAVLPAGPTVRGLETLDGRSVHRGWPIFRTRNALGIEHRVRDVRLRGTGMTPAFGDVVVERVSGDELLARARVAFVPSAWSIKLDERPDGLRVQVDGLPVGALVSVGEDPNARATRAGRDGAASLELGALEAQARRIRIDLRTAAPDKPLRLVVARQVRDGVFVDPDGRALAVERRASISSLAGWRAAAPENHGTKLQIRLVTSSGTRMRDIVALDLDQMASLSALRPLFESILSLGGADAILRLRILVAGRESAPLIISRYSGELEAQIVGTLERRMTRKERAAADLVPAGCAEPAAAPPREPIESCGLLNLTAPSLSIPLHPIPDGKFDQAPLLGDTGPWLVYARARSETFRPLFQQCSDCAVDAVRFSEAMVLAGSARTRDARIGLYSTQLRRLAETPDDKDWPVLEALIDAADGLGELASLDQVQAIAHAPAAAVTLLLRSDQAHLPDRLALEQHSTFAWISSPVAAWAQALSARIEHQTALLRAILPDDPDPEGHAINATVEALKRILALRPELAGHVGCAIIQAGAFRMLPLLPQVLTPNPEEALCQAAERAIGRVGAEMQPFRGLWARRAPNRFASYDRSLRSLTDGPLIAAELALGLRDDWSDARVSLALMYFQHAEPYLFETGLPAAIAWASQS